MFSFLLELSGHTGALFHPRYKKLLVSYMKLKKYLHFGSFRGEDGNQSERREGKGPWQSGVEKEQNAWSICLKMI